MDTAAEVERLIFRALVVRNSHTLEFCFSKDIFNATEDALRNAVEFAPDGESFKPLKEDDTVEISGDKLIITIAEELSGDQNKIKIGPGSLEDADGNTLEDEVTVLFSIMIMQNTVIFKDHDGIELKTETVEHGSSANAPDDPERAGYTFVGWDTDYTSVTENLTVTALYEELLNYFKKDLTSGWNTLSLPIKLQSDKNTIGEIIALPPDKVLEDTVDLIYAYDTESGEWIDLAGNTSMAPMDAVFRKGKTSNCKLIS